MQTLVFYVLLITLALEALFIFRPLVLHVKRYSQKLLTMALKDTLTGLNNRRAFMTASETEIGRAKRHGRNLCVIISDIVKFKSVNDTYGHAVGDAVLKHIAQIISKSFRTEDIYGRIGGEEFAFVLPETSQEQGRSLIERLRKRIEATPCKVMHEGREFDLSYTSSFGLVFVNAPEETLEDLMKRADDALYQAKEDGRNRVVVA